MIEFAICDDEPHMLRELAEYLTAYLEERRVTGCRIHRFSGGSALLNSGGRFDAILLDIQMDAPDGMETARLLRQRGDRSLLIFVTVLRDCVFDAFDVEASGYLLKPLDPASFRRTMDRVLRLLEARGGRSLLLQKGGGCHVVPLSEIVYCEVQGRKLYVHRGGGETIDCYGKLEDLQRRAGPGFFRCHRSYLVNLDCVRGCQDGQVLLPGGEAIPVSRLRERDLIQALLRRMKERDA